MAAVITVRMTAMMSLLSMELLPGASNMATACGAALAGAACVDFERIAIGALHVKDRAWLGRFAAVDASVPGRAAITYARQARALVDPALEFRRLAGVDGGHLPGGVAGAVRVDPPAARGGHD